MAEEEEEEEEGRDARLKRVLDKGKPVSGCSTSAEKVGP